VGSDPVCGRPLPRQPLLSGALPAPLGRRPGHEELGQSQRSLRAPALLPRPLRWRRLRPRAGPKARASTPPSGHLYPGRTHVVPLGQPGVSGGRGLAPALAGLDPARPPQGSPRRVALRERRRLGRRGPDPAALRRRSPDLRLAGSPSRRRPPSPRRRSARPPSPTPARSARPRSDDLPPLPGPPPPSCAPHGRDDTRSWPALLRGRSLVLSPRPALRAALRSPLRAPLPRARHLCGRGPRAPSPGLLVPHLLPRRGAPALRHSRTWAPASDPPARQDCPDRALAPGPGLSLRPPHPDPPLARESHALRDLPLPREAPDLDRLGLGWLGWDRAPGLAGLGSLARPQATAPLPRAPCPGPPPGLAALCLDRELGRGQASQPTCRLRPPASALPGRASPLGAPGSSLALGDPSPPAPGPTSSSDTCRDRRSPDQPERLGSPSLRRSRQPGRGATSLRAGLSGARSCGSPPPAPRSRPPRRGLRHLPLGLHARPRSAPS